jgi:hypothetical protein
VGEWRCSSAILDFDARRISLLSFTPRLLYPRGKSPRYPLYRNLGGPKSRSGRRGQENILNRTGTRTPTPRISASSQSLYRLLCPDSWALWSRERYLASPGNRTPIVRSVAQLAYQRLGHVVTTGLRDNQAKRLEAGDSGHQSTGKLCFIVKLHGNPVSLHWDT